MFPASMQHAIINDGQPVLSKFLAVNEYKAYGMSAFEAR